MFDLRNFEIVSISNLTTKLSIQSHIYHGLDRLDPSKLKLNRNKETFRSWPNKIDLGS
jgi:hypothetical protein